MENIQRLKQVCAYNTFDPTWQSNPRSQALNILV